MPSPITPNKIFESIASIDGDFCEKFIASLQAPALFAQWYKTVFNDDGTLTDDFRAMVCLGIASVAAAPSSPTEPPVVTPPEQPPSQPAVQRPPSPLVSASRGTFPTMIRVSFTTSEYANRYFIQRDGVVIGSVDAPAQPHFDDHVQPARAHTYVVVAVNTTNGLSSLPSQPAFGYSQGYNPGNPPH